MPTRQKSIGASDQQSARLRRLCLVIVGFLVLGTILLYGRTGGYSFVNFDDGKYVGENPVVQGGLSGEGLRYAITETGMSDWYPVLYLSFMAEVTFFGADNPGAHHLVNVGLHLANVLLLFWLLVRWTSSPWKSAVVAALFAFHPLQVESVAWISARKDVLSTFFWLLAMAAYGIYVRRRAARVRSWTWYLAVTALFVAGCLTKAMLVTLPLALLLLDYWPLKRLDMGNKEPGSTRRRLFRLGIEKIPWLAISLAIGVAHLQITKQSVSDLPDLSLLERGAVATVSYAGYLVRLFWPVDLACWYPHPAEVDPEFLSQGGFLIRLAVAGAVLAVISALVVWQAGRRPYLAAGWLWYLLILAPVSGLVSFASFYLADRYAYVPMWGIYWMLAWGTKEVLARWSCGLPLARLAAGSALAACLVLSWRQVRVWKDSRTLFDHTLAVTEHNHFAHNNLGTALMHLGRTEDALEHYRAALRIKPDDAEARNNAGSALQGLGRLEEAVAAFRQALRIEPKHARAHYNLGNALLALRNFEEAIAEYRQALRIQPDYADAHNNWGNALQQLGRPQESLEHYQEALRIQPDFAEARYNWGGALLGLRRFDEAIVQYRQAVRIQPDYAEAHNNLANLLEMTGHLEEAVDHYDKALRVKPDYAQARQNLGNTLVGLGRFEEAIRHFREVLRMEPRNHQAHKNLGVAQQATGRPREAIVLYKNALRLQPNYAEAHNNLAWLLATCSDETCRDGAKAVSHATRARQLIGKDTFTVLDTLAAAHAASGDFPEAVGCQEQALTMAPESAKPDLRRRLDLYKAGKDYRE